MTKKRILLLIAAVLMAMPFGAGIADAGKPTPENPNNTGPEGKPCNADHGHPQKGLAHNKKCQDTEGPPGDETCDDGVDNDGDGDIDQADSDCQEPEGPPGDETCEDGVDNDGDGDIDGEDSDCQGTEGPPGDETCDDGVDNDGDGDIDQADSDCQEPEGPPGDETCEDGVDNDGDGDIDGEDSDCQTPEEICDNDVDDDGDGDIDEEDSDCQTPTEICDNGIDDDGDGAIDGADSDCGTGESNRCHAPNSLSAALDLPPGDHFDTIGHELFAAGIDISPLTEHPEADGELTGQIYDGFAEMAPSPIKEVGFEVACLGDFLIDGEVAPADL